MNLEKSLRQLRREITASPQKAAILGVMVLAGLYFWLPLVAGWLKKPTAAAPAAQTDPNADFLPLVLGTGQPGGGTTVKETETKKHPWRQVAGWIDGDDRQKPLGLPSGVRNPFAEVARPEAEPAAEPAVAVVEPPLTAESLGLALTGTVVGGGRRVAVINGRAYAEGEELTLTAGGKEVTLRIVEVQPHEASLQYNAARMVVKLPRPAISGRIERLETN